MNFGKYLQDKLPTLVFWLAANGLTVLMLYLTPGIHFQFQHYLYILLLQSLLLLAFLLYGYFSKSRWWADLEHNHQQDLLREPLKNGHTNEERFIEEHLNQLLILDKEYINKMLDAANEQRDFIDSWVHEIKVPLAATKLLMESIADHIPEETYYKIENECQRIDAYVEQVLYYSRLDSFSKDYLIQETRLKESVQKAVRPFANYFIQKKLHFSLTGEDLHVLTDRKWLIFILSQLLSNSVKYTPENGQIQMNISQNTEGIWLNITDTGCGIPFEDQRRIFEKGFTGNNGRNQQQKSTGLGLYLSKNLAVKLGHHLYVESKPGHGTTMKIFFPYLTFYNEDAQQRFLSEAS